MEKRDLWIYRISTGLLTAMVALSVIMYFSQYEMVEKVFIRIGYPTYIIYPLAIVKLLGLTAILTRKSEMLKEWAYAGFVFDFILAISAHVNVDDGELWGVVVALILVSASYIYQRKVYKS